MEAADFWKAIKENLLKKGKTQEWLCKECDMDLQSMRNRIYKNRFPSIEEALKILAVFDLKPNQFFGVSENNFENADNFADNSLTSGKNVILVPVMEQVFSAGHGQFVPDAEEVLEYIAVPKELRKFGKNIAACRVKGDSMEPTLFDGDTIICDNKGYDGNDGVYTIIYKGNGFVKRLQRTKEGVRIISDNKFYEPMFESSESEDFSVIGKVRYVLHKM